MKLDTIQIKAIQETCGFPFSDRVADFQEEGSPCSNSNKNKITIFCLAS